MSVKTVIPKDMDFFSAIEKLGGVEKSIDVYENAQQQAVSNGQTVHIFFSQCDACDFRDSFLRFSLLANLNGSGTVVAFQQGIACVINRCRLLSGSDLVFDLVNFNVFYENWVNSNQINAVSSTLNIQMATTDNLATRQASAINPNKIYTLYLGWACGLLNKIYPQGQSQKQLHLELILETPSACLVSDSVNPTYQMLSPQYHYKQITYTETYRQMLRSKLEAGPIDILYLNSTNYNLQIPGSTTTTSNTLPWKYARFLGFNCVARTSSNISSLTYDGKFVNYNNSTIFINDRVKINNVYFPADAVNGITEAFDQYLEFHDLKYNIDTNAATAWTVDPGLFELALNVNQHPKHLNMDDLQIQGQDTSQGSSTIVHEVKFSAPGTAAIQQWDYFGIFFSTISIDKVGNVVYSA
jgi:hypothetical protein